MSHDYTLSRSHSIGSRDVNLTPAKPSWGFSMAVSRPNSTIKYELRITPDASAHKLQHHLNLIQRDVIPALEYTRYVDENQGHLRAGRNTID